MSAPQVKALNCPSCGAPVAVRAFQHTLSVVCENCLSILDAKDPNLQVLQQFQARERIRPLIPLGTRGKLRGEVYEAIGFQVRTIVVEGVPYSWSEYLLFNPYKGFRYLTEYEGHWNDVATLRTLPEVDTSGARPTAKLLGERYSHFQTARAQTTYVLGEFPWQVRVGEVATVMDFVAPPRMLSRETTGEETVWSLGEYLPGARVWEMFQLPGRPPPARSVFADQPTPYQGKVKSAWALCLALVVALFVLAQLFLTFTLQQEVLRRTYSFSARTGSEASFVTDVFELKGRPSNLEISTSTDLSNNWAYFNFTLINAETGEAYDFGREVSYYSGVDSDGSWSEGDRSDAAVIPSVPAGRYYLRVEPEMDSNAPMMQYEMLVRRDVPSMSYFWIAAVLLLIPPIFTTVRAVVFEQRRWRESDYASSGSDSDDSGSGED
jgi:hypothetical protein